MTLPLQPYLFQIVGPMGRRTREREMSEYWAAPINDIRVTLFEKQHKIVISEERGSFIKCWI